ncbi:MAG: RNA polymerase sigma factor, partial [Planctomycetota bacterium]|nr:RNA polymerase sigma factor [Planctomycetota bacterium]
MESRDPDPPLERLLHHRAWLRALAARLVGATAADDLVQDTWLAALQRPPDPTRPPRPWLSTVARRLAGGRRRSEPRPAEAGEGKLPSTAELIERIDTEKRLASEVARLDEPFRTTVLLRYYEGLSSADIARRQGVPGGTVRWRLKRGLELLRERLDGAFGDRRNWGLALGQLLGGTSTAAGGAATLASGGIVMASWVKVGGAAVAAVVLLAGGIALREAWLREATPDTTTKEAALITPPSVVDEETELGDLQPAAPRGARRAPVTSSGQPPEATPAPSL